MMGDREPTGIATIPLFSITFTAEPASRVGGGNGALHLIFCGAVSLISWRAGTVPALGRPPQAREITVYYGIFCEFNHLRYSGVAVRNVRQAWVGAGGLVYGMNQPVCTGKDYRTTQHLCTD